MKSIKNEIRKFIGWLSGRSEQAEERTCKLEDRSIQIVQSEGQKEKIKNNKQRSVGHH